jgi:hypothetical protein
MMQFEASHSALPLQMAVLRVNGGYLLTFIGPPE